MFGLFSYKFDPKTQIPDLTGKVAVVTGANAGQGFHIAEYLALNGAKVYLCARTDQKAQDALEKFRLLHPENKGNGQLIPLKLDLIDPENAVAAAYKISKQESRLDYLVNNASRRPTVPYELTRYGVETLVSVNHIGHFVFTMRLLPLLQRTASAPNSDVRVVTVSSAAHTSVKEPSFATKESAFQLSQGKPGDKNVNGFLTALSRYSYTKYLNILFANELQRRILATAPAGSNPIISMSLHPGSAVATEGAVEMLPWFLKPVQLIASTPLEGAAASLRACTDKVIREEADKYYGAYLAPGGGLSKSSAASLDVAKAKELWALTERVAMEALEVGK